MEKENCVFKASSDKKTVLSQSSVSKLIVEDLQALLKPLLLDLEYLFLIHSLPFNLTGVLESDVFLLADLQKAMREKRNLPQSTEETYLNLGHVAVAVFGTEEFILKCWPMVVNKLADIQQYIMFSCEAASEIRERKREMLLKYGIPPFISSDEFRLLLREQNTRLPIVENPSGLALRNPYKSKTKIAVVGHNMAGKSATIGLVTFQCVGMNHSILEKFVRIQEMGSDYNCMWNVETTNHFIHISKASSLHDVPSEANAVLLIISAAADFETENRKFLLDSRSFSQIMDGKQLIVAVNKMDCTEPPFCKDRYEKIKMIMMKKFEDLGFHSEGVSFIPISAKHGDNVLEISKNLRWFNDWFIKRTEGKTLIEAINEIK